MGEAGGVGVRWGLSGVSAAGVLNGALWALGAVFVCAVWVVFAEGGVFGDAIGAAGGVAFVGREEFGVGAFFVVGEAA